MTLQDVDRACALIMGADITAAYFRVLNALADRYMTPTEIAELCGYSTSNATGVLDRMAKFGLIERQHRSDDRRSAYVTLTPAGKAKLESVLAA